MKFSEKWLREWVDPDVSTQELSGQLTMAGLEVDSVESAAPPLEKVVVGEIKSVEPHPNADKLRVCTVDVGTGQALNIVCGAPQVEAGWRVPTAVVGAQLPGGLKIKKAKLRGVPSEGMLCSTKELGLGEAAEGLMQLAADATPGQPVSDYLQLDDTVIDVDLTPNRGDCLGIAGIAREVGVLNRAAVTPPAMEPVPQAIDDTFTVELVAPQDCPRYVGRIIKGINPKAETPMWMREKLRRSGVRSLGPVVDVTNFVLMELGQPMHAFDLAKLHGGIRVRHAKAGERMMLLDGQEVTLDDETLVIADHEAPQAMAGIMGGKASAVGDQTQDIFLESAYFKPTCIAGKARAYKLHTDSSHRFERSVDPALQRQAMERATALLLDIVGGRPGPVIDVTDTNHLPERPTLRLRDARIRRVLGQAISADDVEQILTRLGASVETADDGWDVMPPSFRADIGLEVDLIEEISRIYGYNRLPSTMPVSKLATVPDSEARVPVDALKLTLVDRGYQEAITYSFVDPKLQKWLDPGQAPIALENPISADMSVMRTNLLPGLVQALVHNLHRQQERVRLFEYGMKFNRQHDDMQQENALAGVVSGWAEPEQWSSEKRAVDFYDVKADVEALLDLTGASEAFTFAQGDHPALHPGQCARITRKGRVVGWLGALHPDIESELGLEHKVYVFELEAEPLRQGTLPVFHELSRYPMVRRDLAVVVDESVTFNQVRDCIYSAAPGALKDLQVFDVYRGKGIDLGRKSLALGLTFQALERTLSDDEVDTFINEILSALSEQLGAVLRS